MITAPYATPLQHPIRSSISCANPRVLIGIHSGIHGKLITFALPDRAITAFQRCVEIQRQLANDSGEVDALISLGLAHSKAGNNLTAIRFLEDALDHFQLLPPEDASAHSGKAVCLDHLGHVYSKLGKAEKAVTYYTMSLRVKKDIGDMTGEAR